MQLIVVIFSILVPTSPSWSIKFPHMLIHSWFCSNFCALYSHINVAYFIFQSCGMSRLLKSRIVYVPTTTSNLSTVVVCSMFLHMISLISPIYLGSWWVFYIPIVLLIKDQYLRPWIVIIPIRPNLEFSLCDPLPYSLLNLQLANYVTLFHDNLLDTNVLYDPDTCTTLEMLISLAPKLEMCTPPS